jgi:F-type H+-transporting ATPase subunit epsilon
MELTILTTEKSIFSGEVESVQLPGSLGLMGVLNRHAPIISGIEPGIIKIKSQGHIDSYFISGGFFECYLNKAILFADAFESPEYINKTRAEKAAIRAKERLFKRRNIDVPRAQRALARALARLKACK